MKDKTPIVGYIVFSMGGYSSIGPLEWDTDWKSLAHGDNATLFRTRRQAHAAIQKSIRFAKARNFMWVEDMRRAEIFAVRTNGRSRKS